MADIPANGWNPNRDLTCTSHLPLVACVFLAVSKVWENGGEITDLRRSFPMGKVEQTCSSGTSQIPVTM